MTLFYTLSFVFLGLTVINLFKDTLSTLYRFPYPHISLYVFAKCRYPLVTTISLCHSNTASVATSPFTILIKFA